MKYELKRRIYRFKNYNLIKTNNYYEIKGNTYISFGYDKLHDGTIINEDLEKIFDDLIKMAENLYLCIEDEKNIYDCLTKENKTFNIMFPPFTSIHQLEFNINDDLIPNNNGIIEILNYDQLINNTLFCNEIISFCKKYNSPYYINFDDDEIKEVNFNMEIQQIYTSNGKQNGSDYYIKAKDLIFTSITMYLLEKLKQIITPKNVKKFDNNLRKLFHINQQKKTSASFYKKKIKELLDDFENNFDKRMSWERLCCYCKSEYNTETITFITDNLIVACFNYYINYHCVKNHIIPCAKCGKIRSEPLQKHLCSECYNKDPNYVKNQTRNKLNKQCKKLIGSLQELNNDEVNSIIKNTTAYKTKFKDSSKKDKEILSKTYKKWCNK